MIQRVAGIDMNHRRYIKPRKTIADRIHEKFYAWFERWKPTPHHVIEDGFTRRQLRDAYEAGFRAGKRCRDIGEARR